MAGRQAQRPPYWSADYVLAELHEGRTVTEQIRQAIEDLGEPLSRECFWADIHAWKKKLPGFADDYQAAMEACYALRDEKSSSVPGNGRPEEFGPAQQFAFLQEMAANGGNLQQAAYDCGVSPRSVHVRINPKSPLFDRDFADRFYEAEAARGAMLYEKVWEHGMKEDGEGNIRQPLILMRLAETRLPHLFNPKRQVEIEGNIRHAHELIPAAATRQIAETRQALLGPSEQTPEEALDAEYVEVGEGS